MIMSKLTPNIEADTEADTQANTRAPTIVHVAVAVIVDQKNRVLIARRAQHVHQGGLWEFPGGKVELGESNYDALCREVFEELQIQIQSAQPLIRIPHHYNEQSVLLDVWQVTRFIGEPQGAEGQAIEWRAVNDLVCHDFPAANRKIIAALQYPSCLLITGEFSDLIDFNCKLANALESGVKLVQLRCKLDCSEALYKTIAESAAQLCESAGAQLLLNAAPELAEALHLGLHLNSKLLHSYTQRPVATDRWLSASCHNLRDIKQAEALHVDFILLSPVKKTSSHPQLDGLGWQRCSAMLAHTVTPAYALGGLSMSDLNDARQAGAQGVAAISAFWSRA